MTTAAVTRTEIPGFCQLFTGTLTTAVTTSDPIEVPGAADKTVQFTGTWGGATAAVEGSNDGSVYAALHGAHDGSAITATDDTKIACIVENPRYIRLKLTTAGSGASVGFYVVARTT